MLFRARFVKLHFLMICLSFKGEITLKPLSVSLSCINLVLFFVRDMW